MPSFTPHQDAALKAVADWLKAKPGRNGTPPVFRLFGYAGTGKTTLARHIADGVDGEVKFAAFTGKAALVMRNKLNEYADGGLPITPAGLGSGDYRGLPATA